MWNQGFTVTLYTASNNTLKPQCVTTKTRNDMTHMLLGDTRLENSHLDWWFEESLPSPHSSQSFSQVHRHMSHPLLLQGCDVWGTSEPFCLLSLCVLGITVTALISRQWFLHSVKTANTDTGMPGGRYKVGYIVIISIQWVQVRMFVCVFFFLFFFYT